MNWPLVRFKDVSKVVTGGTPKKIEANYGGNIPFVTPGDLGVHSDVGVSKVYLTRRGADTVRLLPKGAVMVCCIGATIGKVGIAKTEVTTNQQINSLVFDESTVFPKYGYYYCSTIKEKLVAKSSSTTMPIINKNNFSELEIPLPPLAEQKRIAAILDKADAIRRKRQQAIQLADDFLRSVFLDMFGDPVSNPKGWEVTSLPSHGLFKNGLNFRKGESGVSIRYLGVGDFKALTSIDDALSLGTIELDDFPAEDYLLQDEDLVFVRSNGNKALVGRCISVYPKNEKLTFSGFCIRYRVTDSCVEPEYLNYLLRTPSMKVAMLKGGQGANIQNINQKILSELDVPLPPKDIQGKFCNIAKAYKALARKLDKGEDSKATLFDSVSQEAFSGKL